MKLTKRSPFGTTWLWGSLCVGAMALPGCGGGGESVLQTETDNPAGVASYAGTSASYLGTISGLGSIVVNGVRFESTSARVHDSDDLYGDVEYLDPLAMGMTVALEGSADDAQALGRAHRIRVVGGVRGTVSEASSTQLVVGGQTVVINNSTLIATHAGQLTAASVQVGDFVNIDGLTQADRRFLATRVVRTHASAYAFDAAWRGESANAVQHSTGWTMHLNTGDQSPLEVSCPLSSCVVQPSGASLSDVHALRVLAVDDTQRNGQQVVASRIQVLDVPQLLQWSGSAPSLTKIKGVAAVEGTVWTVGGVQVLSPLVPLPWVAGRFYEVKGTLTNGQLTVTQWEQEGQERDRWVSSGQSADDATYYRQALYGAVSGLQGTRMTVQGTTVELGQARFEQGSLATLVNGAYVEVKGVLSNGVLVASQVEIKTGSAQGVGTRFEVYGTLSHWSATGFTLTSGDTVYSGVLTPQTRIEQEHGLVGNGQWVEAKGYMNAGQFVAVKLEVKRAGDHDD
jgi:hypothetical protein